MILVEHLFNRASTRLFCFVFTVNLRLSIDVSDLKMLIVKDTSTSHMDSTNSQRIEGNFCFLFR